MLVVPVATLESVEVLRQLRNRTSAGFSSFNGYITRDMQHEWWRKMHDRLLAWVYWEYQHMKPIGFGLVREDRGKMWNSIGVHPDYQGRGFGSFITHDILTRVEDQVYSTVRRDNPSAIAMHHTADWEEIDGPEPDKLVYLRSRER